MDWNTAMSKFYANTKCVLCTAYEQEYAKHNRVGVFANFLFRNGLNVAHCLQMSVIFFCHLQKSFFSFHYGGCSVTCSRSFIYDNIIDIRAVHIDKLADIYKVT